MNPKFRYTIRSVFPRWQEYIFVLALKILRWLRSINRFSGCGPVGKWLLFQQEAISRLMYPQDDLVFRLNFLRAKHVL